LLRTAKAYKSRSSKSPRGSPPGNKIPPGRSVAAAEGLGPPAAEMAAYPSVRVRTIAGIGRGRSASDSPPVISRGRP
jgi:hypothetical protein